MELQEVRVIINHAYDFFQGKRIETFVQNIPIQKQEIQISEINKLAIVKMEHASNPFLLIIHPQAIQLHLQSLEQLEIGLTIFEVLEEPIRQQLKVDFVLFNGVIDSETEHYTYNQLLHTSLSDKLKVKMLGIDLKSANYEYRLSLNKEVGRTKVNAKARLQCNLNGVSSKIYNALEELNEELVQLKDLL